MNTVKHITNRAGHSIAWAIPMKNNLTGEYILAAKISAFLPYVDRLLKEKSKPEKNYVSLLRDELEIEAALILGKTEPLHLEGYSWYSFVPEDLITEIISPDSHSRTSEILSNQSGPAAVFLEEDTESGLYILALWPQAFRSYISSLIQRREIEGTVLKLLGPPPEHRNEFMQYLGDRLDLFEWYRKVPDIIILELKEALLEESKPLQQPQPIVPIEISQTVQKPPENKPNTAELLQQILANKELAQMLNISPDAVKLVQSDTASETDKPVDSVKTNQPDQQDLFSSSEVNLRRYYINRTGTGYYSLKSGRANMAIWRYARNKGYILGIKDRSRLGEIKALLSHAQFYANNCPVEFIPLFSPHGGFDWPHLSYDWFLVPDASSLKAAIEMIDH